MKKVVISVIAIFPLMVTMRAWALPSQTDVLIVGLQVRGIAAADQEFVELYNTTDKPIDVSAWKLQYKSATGTSWTDKTTLHGSLDAHSHYLLVSDKYPNPPIAALEGQALALDVFNAGLSDSAGHVRIADFVVPTVPVVHDLLAWGTTANAAEGNMPAVAPGSGKGLQRKSSDGKFIDTDNNSSDFELSSSPLAQADPLYVALVIEPIPTPEPAAEPITTAPDPDPSPTGSTTQQPPVTPPSSDDPPSPPAIVLMPPQITELLPNPAAPASDSTDEFIELYNPNDGPLDLKGYKLQSGNTFSYNYTFDVVVLAAHEYRAFLVTQTGDILSNTSGQARLLDSVGIVVGQTDQYGSAKEGQAWALINDPATSSWQWTTTPTPNVPNVLTAEAPKPVGVVKTPTIKAPSSKAPAKTTSAKSTAKPKATTAVKSAKTTTPTTRQVYQDPAATPPPLHSSILAGVGVITLLYAGYEYRYDAANTYRRLQRYRGLRRASRTTSAGR